MSLSLSQTEKMADVLERIAPAKWLAGDLLTVQIILAALVVAGRCSYEDAAAYYYANKEST